MIGVGIYFMRKNSSSEDYYVGGRNMSAGHIGLSVVATDVGGGFSIGLGGLGFTIGLSGSWMLFTGLIGAWLSAVILIPRVYKIARNNNFLTFPELLGFFYNKKVAIIAAIISLIGYIGFTSSQILAGAKLASASFPEISILQAVLIMGIIAVVYTVIGGIKAVIYTDTIQWLILLFGLIFIGIPFGYYKIGGWEAIQETIGPEFMSLTQVGWVDIFNWMITIIPIWFIGMTLYQRIFACRDEKTAIKAWKIAGFFEWPFMAFMGVLLGIFARVAFAQNMFSSSGYLATESIDPELGLPLFLTHILPIGLLGLMMSAYFSAIMSTADSCLMAASGNLTTDILGSIKEKYGKSIFVSQLTTFLIGVFAILLATIMTNVLDLMLYSYAFMVSGLFVPVLAALFIQRPNPLSAMIAMLGGGAITLTLIILNLELPYGINENFFGIMGSLVLFIATEISINKKIQWRTSH